MKLNEDYTQELIEALKIVRPIRDKIQKTLMETHDEILLDKLISINKIISNAEIILHKKKDISSFYAENYPEFVSNNEAINATGVQRLQILKKKWKKLGFLKKN